MRHKRLEYREAVRGFVSQCTERFGDRLVSVVLYGSYARGDYTPGFSDLDFLVVLKPDGKKDLERDYRVVSWIKMRISREFGITFDRESVIIGPPSFFRKRKVFFPLEAKTVMGARLVEKQPIGRSPAFLRKTSIHGLRHLAQEWKNRRRKLYPQQRARLALNYSIRAAQNALLLKHQVAVHKVDVVRRFEASFPDFEFNWVPRRALRLIRAWERYRTNHRLLAEFVETFNRFFVRLLSLMEGAAHASAPG